MLPSLSSTAIPSGDRKTGAAPAFSIRLISSVSGKNQLSVISRGSETPAFFPCKRVTVFSVDEQLLQEFGQKIPPEDADENAPAGTFMWPTSLTVDSKGNTYVADEWLQRITVFDKDGECTGTWGKQGSGEGEFNKPSGLACDANDRRLPGGQLQSPGPGLYRRRAVQVPVGQRGYRRRPVQLPLGYRN